MGLKAVPYVANTASIIAKKVYYIVQVGRFGDMKTSSRYITTETALRLNPNIEIGVGDSLGCSVALGFSEESPRIKL